MTRKTVGFAALLMVLTMTAAGVAVAALLPADVQLPIHWGLDGRPDRFADKWTALLLPSIVFGGVSCFFWFQPALEPRKQSLERSQSLYLWAWIAVLLVGAAIQLATVSTALGWGLSVPRLIGGAVGAMLVLIGNQLGKTRTMYTIGIRTPWTLASEDVWVRTHRLAGKLMVAAGLIVLAAAAAPLPPSALGPIVIGAAAVAALVPAIYSYLLWRREVAAQPSE